MASVREYIDGAFKNDPSEQEIGINGFTTFALVRDSVSRSSSVPTTFLEDGSPANNHIINNPIVLSIEGQVSDVQYREGAIVSELARIAGPIGIIEQYTPGRTLSQAVKVSALTNDFNNALNQIDSNIDNGQQLYNFLGGSEISTKNFRERFLDMIESVWESKSLISIDTAFRTYNNMAITSVEVVRDNQHAAISFSITAQQFRFTDLILLATGLSAPNPSSGLKGLAEQETDKGLQEGEEVESSLLTTLLGG